MSEHPKRAPRERDTRAMIDDLRRRVREMSDDTLRSEYVSACHPWAERDLVALEMREACEREAIRRGLKLRTRVQTMRELLAEMKGF